MPPKPSRNKFLKLVLETALCAIPVAIPTGIWFAWHGRFPAYKPSAADILALTSGFIILAVFMVQQHYRIIARFKREGEKRSLDIEELRRFVKDRVRVESSAAPRPATVLPDLKEPSPGNRVGSIPPRKPEPQTELYEEPLPAQSAPPPELSEKQISDNLHSKYIETIRSIELTPDMLASQLQRHSDELSLHPVQVKVIYRNAAIEEVSGFHCRQEGLRAPSPSILMLFQSGSAHLYPAPMAGQDCFQDVKAFESATPTPSQMRSRLTQCHPAQLAPSGDESFGLRQHGRLDFYR